MSEIDSYAIAREVARKFHFDQDSLNREIAQYFVAAPSILQTMENAAYDQMRPSVLYRPALTVDGNMYCALYGVNLQEGCAGFGASPSLAMADFDKNWDQKLRNANV